MQRSFMSMAMLLAALLGAPASRADDGVVGNGNAGSCTEAALDAALGQLYPGANFPGGNLTFDCGSAMAVIPLTSRKVLGQSSGTLLDGGGRVTFDGQDATGLFAITGAESRVELRGVNLIRGHAVNAYGGALAIGADTFVSLTDVALNDNRADFSGGAIHAEAGASLVLERVSVFQNTAQNGGGIAANGALTLRNSRVERNLATVDQGGGVQLWFGALTASNTVFGANAAANGGALLQRGGTAALTDVIFDQNRADARGAGIALYDGGQLAGTGLVFTGNNADEGGALHLQGSDSGLPGEPNQGAAAALVHSRLYGNTATHGGGIRITGPAPGNGGSYASLDLRLCTVEHNTAADRGGGVHSDGLFTATDVEIVDNHAQADGGGVYAAPSFVPGTPIVYTFASLTRVTLRDNSALVYGGGMQIDRALVVFEQVNFIGNTAGAGGGLSASGLQFPLANASFLGNSAQLGGGLLVNLDAGATPLQLRNLTFSDNVATGEPGAPRAPGGDMFLYASDVASRSAQLLHLTLLGGDSGVVMAGDSISASDGLPIRLKGTVLLGNNAVQSCAGGVFSSAGGNVAAAGCGANAPSDLAATALAPLGLVPIDAANAYLRHFLPAANSVLRDRLDCDADRNIDARGLPVGVDATGDGLTPCDSGAIERQAVEASGFPFFRDGFESP